MRQFDRTTGPERRRVNWLAFGFMVVAGMTLVMAGLSAVPGPTGNGPQSVAEGAEPTPTPTVSPPRSADVVKKISAEDVSAVFVSGNTAPVIHRDQIAKIVVVFRNTGSVAWIRGTGSEARLGVFGDSRSFDELGMAVDWPVADRPAIQDEQVVPPDGTAQFSFRVRGTEPGRFQAKVGPVIDGVAWARAFTTLDVTVR